MSFFKYQWHLFATAMGFFSRIPCHTEYRKESQNRCIRYFPLVGLVLGVIGAAIFLLASWLLPVSVSVILSMAATILATGAFHEDGFADVCDSFGGGWTKGKILLIMKDSRVGAYGVIGMVLMLLCKFLLISELDISLIAIAIIVAHILSRSMASTTMYALVYVRDDETSKSKSITQNIRFKDIAFSMITGAASIMLLPSLWYFIVLAPLFIVKYLIERWFVKWIGGYTGDCLGAIQQISEVVIFMTVLVVSRKIGIDDSHGLISLMKGLTGQ